MELDSIESPPAAGFYGGPAIAPLAISIYKRHGQKKKDGRDAFTQSTAKEKCSVCHLIFRAETDGFFFGTEILGFHCVSTPKKKGMKENPNHLTRILMTFVRIVSSPDTKKRGEERGILDDTTSAAHLRYLLYSLEEKGIRSSAALRCNTIRYLLFRSIQPICCRMFVSAQQPPRCSYCRRHLKR